MKETIIVSTLICTYNAEKFITKTLDSVINQTYKNQEILIRDDWSKDKTIEIINEYKKNNKWLFLFTSENEWFKLWPYWWLNFLLDHANWKYIAIQDHDDIWHPEKIKLQIDFLEKNKKYIWCWTWTLMYFWKSERWYIVDNININTNKVIHTSLVFRNDWFSRYDAKNDFLWDTYFMKNILCWWWKKMKTIWKILTLHYYKESWDNYSEQRFKFNLKNIKRYFNVYWFWIFSFFYFLYLLLSKILPYPFKKFITFNLTLRNKLIFKDLLKKEYNCSELLRYF